MEETDNPFAAPVDDAGAGRGRPGRFSLDAADRKAVALAGTGAIGMGVYFYFAAGLYTLLVAFQVYLIGPAALFVMFIPAIFVILMWVLGAKFFGGGRSFRNVLDSGDETGKLVRAFDDIGQAFAIMGALMVSTLALIALVFVYALVQGVR